MGARAARPLPAGASAWNARPDARSERIGWIEWNGASSLQQPLPGEGARQHDGTTVHHPAHQPHHLGVALDALLYLMHEREQRGAASVHRGGVDVSRLAIPSRAMVGVRPAALRNRPPPCLSSHAGRYVGCFMPEIRSAPWAGLPLRSVNHICSSVFICGSGRAARAPGRSAAWVDELGVGSLRSAHPELEQALKRLACSIDVPRGEPPDGLVA